MDETQLFDEDEQQLFAILNDAFETASAGQREGCQSDTDLQDAAPNVRGMLRCLEQLRGLAAEVRMPVLDPPCDAEPETSCDGTRTDAAPQKFGRYEIVRQLGHGGMGIVFEARHPGLEKSVAL